MLSETELLDQKPNWVSRENPLAIGLRVSDGLTKASVELEKQAAARNAKIIEFTRFKLNGVEFAYARMDT